MDEEVESTPPTRTSFAVRFSEQFRRYRKLLFKYCWILILTVGPALALQYYFLRHVTPAYVCVGRMIVKVKFSVQTANAYAEEAANFYGTQMELMKSESVAYLVRNYLRTNNPDLTPAPV